MVQRVQGRRSVRGRLHVPGDKAVAHRAYVFNAMARGRALVTGIPRGEDCASTLRCLRDLGVPVEERDGGVAIEGVGKTGFTAPSGVLDAGNSGTTMRFLAGLLAAQPFESVITGDDSLRRRPMARIIDPLRRMGARIEGAEGGRAPLRIAGGALKGIEYHTPVASAQVKTALLIAGCNAQGETVVVEPAPSRNHSELMLAAMEADIETADGRIRIRPGELRARDVAVPGDISSAAYWITLGVAHPDADITVTGVGLNPSRTGIIDVLRSMGADVAVENVRDAGGETVGDVRSRSSRLRGTVVEGPVIPRAIDELPLVALAAALADGPTEIRDAAELRVKESDRIATTAMELAKFGVSIEERPDGLRIEGGAMLHGAECASHGDHRLAMMLAVAGIIAEGETAIGAAEAAAVTYPEFWGDLLSLSPPGPGRAS